MANRGENSTKFLLCFVLHCFVVFVLFGRGGRVAVCGILVPLPGFEPVTPAVET